MKSLRIMDEDGQILESLEFTGGYNIAFSNNDGGNIKHICKMQNGKMGKYQIKNYTYQPLARLICGKFEELKYARGYRILYLEDTDWKPGTAKQPWIAQIRKAGKHFEEMTGYSFVVELRSYYMDKMSREQVTATIYHELRHIDEEGGLIKHDIEDWGNMVATLGRDWATTEASIPDILGPDFDTWWDLSRADKQVSLFDRDTTYLRAVK